MLLTKKRRRCILLLLGSPSLAVGISTAIMVLADYLRAPPTIAPLMIAVIISNAFLATAGSAMGGLWIASESVLRIPVAVLAGIAGLFSYCFFGFIIVYAILARLAIMRTGQFISP